jgi:phosphinothricin acetyltransferase
MIRPVTPGDSAAICAIYNYYVENTTHTFEETAVSPEEMEERIRIISAKYPYLVMENNSGEVTGFAYVNTWKERSSYRFTAEISIYVKESCRGMGMGRSLMEELLGEIRKTNIHSVVAGIVFPNDRSIALHEKFGFKKIGQFNEIGFKFNQWPNIGYWELLI